MQSEKNPHPCVDMTFSTRESLLPTGRSGQERPALGTPVMPLLDTLCPHSNTVLNSLFFGAVALLHDLSTLAFWEYILFLFFNKSLACLALFPWLDQYIPECLPT